MSSAAVSLATTQPRSRRPSTSGCTPCGSRAAYRVCSSMKVRQKAPRRVGSSSIAACSIDVSPAACASSAATRSESVVAAIRSLRVPSRPASRTLRARSEVLTRLPLWPSAMEVPAEVVRKVGWAFSQLVDPVVEYRVCPMATWPFMAESVCSSNTWLTRPRSLNTSTWAPSPTAIPAASWPRCCSAYKP